MALTPSERSQRARIGGFALSAQRDPVTYTQAARTAFLERFVNLVDPDRVLDPDERDRRATAALRAHMAALSYRSSRQRHRRATRGSHGGGR